MKLNRRKLLSGAAALAYSLPAKAQTIFSLGVSSGGGGGGGGGLPPTNFLTTNVGIVAGSLNMLPWTALGTFTDFTNAQFSTTNASFTGGVSSPDGAHNAIHLKESGSAGNHSIGCSQTPKTQSLGLVPFRMAFIAQAAERTRVVLNFQNGGDGNSNISVCFDLSGGNTNFSNVIGSNMSLKAAAVTSLGGGWWLGTFDFVYALLGSTSIAWQPSIFLDNGSGTAAQSISYTGNGTSGVNLFWWNILPLAAWSMTSQAFVDDFNNLASIDVNNTLAGGFKWYVNNLFPNSSMPTFGWQTRPPAFPSPAANFSIASPSVLKIYNPNQANGFTAGMTSIATDGGNGFIGQVFGGPQMRDTYMNWTGHPTPDPNWSGNPAFWGSSVEAMTNNGLNPSFHFLEWDIEESGLTSTQISCFQHNQDLSNPPSPLSLNAGSLQTFSSNTDPTFHRLSSIWVPATVATSGWGLFIYFIDGQQQDYNCQPYNRAVSVAGVAAGAFSQSDWHRLPIITNTGEDNSADGLGGWPLLIDWIRVYTNPSPPVVYAFWDIFDQAGVVAATATGGILVLDTNGLQLTKTNNDAAWDMIRASHGKGAGKWYWEITLSGTVATATSLMLGMANQAASVASGAFPGSSASGAGARHGSNWNSFVNGVVGVVATAVTFAASDVFGFAFDADLGKVYIHRNGTWINGTPASGNAVWTGLTTATPGVAAAGWYPTVAIHDITAIATANFGASAFAFAVPPGYNSGVF